MNTQLKLSTLAVFLLFSKIVSAQVQFISPLPNGILQVHDAHSDLRLHAALSGYSSFSYELIPSIDTSIFHVEWTSVNIINDTVDTLLTLPSALKNYTLYCQADSDGTKFLDTIAGLTPGHIIGVAGQSNAQGYCWTMNVAAIGDIRMLTPGTNGNLFWGPAHEPTGGVAGGPWIVMANMLYASIGDSLPIGIVNTAVGGTGLLYNYDTTAGQWLRNPSNPEDTTTSTYGIYGRALRFFRQAGSEIEWLTWIQGEAEGGYGGDPVPQTYQIAFKNLITELEGDLGDTFQTYHLQIGGDAASGAWIGDFPQVHEAQLLMPPSTIVGTGLGLALWDGIYHYDPPSLWSIGKMFAAAILKQQYDISSPMYPPLIPDNIATLDSITDGSIMGRYCFSIGWSRGGMAVKLKSLTSFQYFALDSNGFTFDTSLVSYRVSPGDSSRVQIWLRNGSITPHDNWLVTYDAAAESERAPLATIDPISGDTIYGAAFNDIPISLTPSSVIEPTNPIPNPEIIPNPASRSISIDASSLTGPVEASLLSETGAIVWQQSLPADHPSPLAFDLSSESSGCYLLRLSNGSSSIEKKFILER